MTLVKANSNLIINPDLIVAANWDQEENLWRIFVVGHNAGTPAIRMTEAEMTTMLDNVEVPKMMAILNAAKPLPARSQPKPLRTPGDAR